MSGRSRSRSGLRRRDGSRRRRRRRRSSSSRSRFRHNSRRRRLGETAEFLVGNAELSRPLILTGSGNDKKQTVVRHIRLESGGRCPVKFAGIFNAVGQGLDGLDVAAGSTEEHQGDFALRCWRPGDGVGLSGRYLVAQTGESNGIALGILAVVGLSVGCSQADESADQGDEAHFEWISTLENTNMSGKERICETTANFGVWQENTVGAGQINDWLAAENERMRKVQQVLQLKRKKQKRNE